LKIYHLGGGGTKKKVMAKTTIEYYQSLYKFFLKNRGALEYWLLRLLKPLKVLANLLLCGLGLILSTLGGFQHERIRAKFLTYLKVLEWHLLGCPENWGLRR
jgi:hypothetical protein